MTIREAEQGKRQAGLGLLEFALAATVLATGSLAFFGAMLGSLKIAHQSRQINQANDQAMNVIEAFRYRASQSFEDALTEFDVDGDPNVDDRVLYQRQGEIAVSTRVVLDETLFSPRVDLNGDGDTNDTALLPDEVLAGFLMTTVSWEDGARSLTFVTLVARDELKPVPPSESTDPDPVVDPVTGDPIAPPEHVTLGIGWVNYDNDLGTLSLGLASEAEIPVIGIQVDATKNVRIADIRVANQTVFSQMSDLPPGGTLIPVEPFTLQAGLNTIDHIMMVDAKKDKPAKVTGMGFTVTFFLESGQTAVVTLDKP